VCVSRRTSAGRQGVTHSAQERIHAASQRQKVQREAPGALTGLPGTRGIIRSTWRIGAHRIPMQEPARTRACGRRALVGARRVPRRAVVLQAAVGVGGGRGCRAQGLALARCRRSDLASGLPVAAVLARGLRAPAGGLLGAVALHSRARALAGVRRVLIAAWSGAAAQACGGMLRHDHRMRAGSRAGTVLGGLGRLSGRRPCGRAVVGRAAVISTAVGRARRRTRVCALIGRVRRGRADGGLGMRVILGRVVLGRVRARVGVGRWCCGRVRAGGLGLRDQAGDPLPRLGLRALANLHVVRRPGVHLRAGRVSRRLSRRERGEGQQVHP